MNIKYSTLTLTTPAQRRAIASPLRMELLEAVRHAGQASVADLARLTARRPTALHYHVGVLHRAGLLVIADNRRAGKGTETVYRTAADAFAVPTNPGKPRIKTDGSHTAAAMLRLTQREVARSLANPDTCPAGPQRNFHLRRLRAPLRPAALARANALLDRLEQLFLAEFEHAAQGHGKSTSSPAAAPDPVSLTFALTATLRSKGPTDAPAKSTKKKPRRARS